MTDEREFRTELQRAARAERPHFSSARHAHIMDAVLQAKLIEGARKEKEAQIGSPSVQRRLALAASVAAAIFWAGWSFHQTSLDPNTQTNTGPPRAALSPDVMAIDSVNDVAGIIELALAEFDMFSQFGQFATFEERDYDVQRRLTANYSMAEQALLIVGDRAVKHWTDLEKDARLLTSSMQARLPSEVAP